MNNAFNNAFKELQNFAAKFPSLQIRIEREKIAGSNEDIYTVFVGNQSVLTTTNLYAVSCFLQGLTFFIEKEN